MDQLLEDSQDDHLQKLKPEGALHSVVAEVPGEHAPSANLLRLWNSMIRWLLATRSNFAQFLRSLLQPSQSAEDCTPSTLWPMPLPYPEWLQPRASGSKCSYPTMCRQKAVNMAVLMLNWLHLRRPKHPPASMRVGRRLTPMQWQTVKRLEKYFFEVSFEGDIGPAQMGRTAAKMEGLDQTLHRLQAQATELHVADYRTKLRKHGKEKKKICPLCPEVTEEDRAKWWDHSALQCQCKLRS